MMSRSFKEKFGWQSSDDYGNCAAHFRKNY
jgi:hypothetical protein